MEKCRPFGVMVPLSSWWGVRACELRNSPCGLLSERATSFSYFDAICTGGMIEPNSRLHCSSLSGSAAAPVMVPAAPMAPATAMPFPSKARRSIRPLPATRSGEGVRPRRWVVLMISSLTERRHMRPLIHKRYMLRFGAVVVQAAIKSTLRIFALDFGEETFLLQAVENAGVDVIIDIPAFQRRELVDDILRARPRWFEIDWRLLLEVVVARVDDLRVDDPGLSGQHFLGTPLIGQRQIGSLDRGLQKPRQYIARALKIAGRHHDGAEQPRNLLGNEIDHRGEAGLVGKACHRLVDGGALDLARFERLQASHAAAIFLENDVVPAHAEAGERPRGGGMAFRTERADADHAAIEVGCGLHAGRCEESEADHIAE